MDYKKKYEEALERAKKSHAQANSFIKKACIENIFPELKESEDERIRKELYKYFQDLQLSSDREFSPTTSIDKILTWLKKQCKNNMGISEDTKKKLEDNLNKALEKETPESWNTFLEKQREKEKLVEWSKDDEVGLGDALWAIEQARTIAKDENDMGNLCYAEKWLKSIKDRVLLQTKQDEQKSNKIESKFKVGDWIIRNAEGFKHNIYLVTEVKDYYVCEDLNGTRVTFTFNDVHKNFKLWDISDAKDGDVLANGEMIVIFKYFEDPSYRQHIVAYIGLDMCGNIQITDDTWSLGIDKAKPATKEQRDNLEKAITEAGYKWNAEKKELKKFQINQERF